MRISRFNWLSLALVSVVPICAAQAQSSPKRAPKNVTGHYRLTKQEFRNCLDVQQLTGGKIEFDLLALWVSYNNPHNIHNGELHGTALLDDGVAIYDQDECKIKIEFFLDRVRVTQIEDSGCGFGANVTAAGTYRKLNNKKPKFDF
ncbi:MAG: hypothetical protein ABJB61_11480 [bacterium]